MPHPFRPRAAAAAALTGAALLTAAAPADADTLQVKFRDDTTVTATGSDLQLAYTPLQQRIDAILRSNGVADDASALFGAQDRLDALREKLTGEGKDVPDLTTWIELEVPAARIDAVRRDLQADPAVELAQTVPEVSTPQASSSYPVPDLRPQQQRWQNAFQYSTVFDNDGIKGENTRVFDIEEGFNPNHIEFTGQSISSRGTWKPEDTGHATAVISTIAGKRDGRGIDGIAPSSSVTLLGGYDSIAGRLVSVLDPADPNRGRPGDVVLIELAFTPGYPVTANGAILDAVETLTATGVNVIVPAGNGNLNLDARSDMTRSNASQSDWVLVGAGNTGTDGCGGAVGTRAGFSSYGARVDVQGPGLCVPSAVVAGSQTETLAGDPSTVNDDYTVGFNGTSSASAVVAGLTASMSGAFKASYGEPLTPELLRSVLRSTGAQQTAGGAAGNIGPRVQWVNATQALLATPKTSVSTDATTSFERRPALTWSSATSQTGQCRIYKSGSVAPAWASCGTTFRPAADLADGDYVFEARATKGGSFDPTPARTRVYVRGGGGSVVALSNAWMSVVDDYDLDNDITLTDFNGGAIVLVEDEKSPVRAEGANCTQRDANSAYCVLPVDRQVLVASWGGDDVVDASTLVRRANMLAGDGNDTFLGGAGNDYAQGGAGDDSLRGGAGKDKLTGDEGDDELFGDAGDDTLSGGSGLDMIYGGDGADAINGGADLDGLQGQGGNDSIVSSGDGSLDYVACGAGTDTADVDTGDSVPSSAACEQVTRR